MYLKRIIKLREAPPYSGELHTILEIALSTLRYYFMQIKADSVPI
jgi:hypothetical protein